jgi:FKBP-type peptidyl-prolyl cis-trans isomerase
MPMKKTFGVGMAVLVLTVAGLALTGCDSGANKLEGNWTTTKSGLKYEDFTVGTGAEAKLGDSVDVHYVGKLRNGKQFDSSRDRGKPFNFQLGAGGVIQGWDEGVTGMKVGGVRKLLIPPDLGYGAKGFPPTIPGNAELFFEIELLKVK